MQDNAVSPEKAAFLQQHQKAYGYRNKIDRMRQQEFARLGRRVYVDHAGSTLYAASQLRDVLQVCNCIDHCMHDLPFFMC